MPTIPAKKFEEWIETYTKGMSHCRTGQCGRDCPLYKEDNCETTLAQHLAFKSKEYIEANQ